MSNVAKPGLKNRQFIRHISDKLRDTGIRKTIVYPNRTFYITDEDGNCRMFKVRTPTKEVLYSTEDIERIIDAMYAVVEDCIRRGETIYIHNKFMICTKYRKPRITKVPGSDEIFHVPGHYVPKFTFGSEAKMAAKAYDGTPAESQGEDMFEDYDLGEDSDILSDIILDD